MMIDIPVPDGESGIWRIETFIITPEMVPLRGLLRPREYIGAGTYRRLLRGETTVMSNTPMEVRSNQPIIRHAKGNVLINGLGLGMVLVEILKKPDVRHVTVVEISQDVINLVMPSFAKHVQDGRLGIIHGNALDYRPIQTYGAVWHDIWDDICTYNLADMKLLTRRYGRRAAWQGSWAREECELIAKRRYRY